MRTRKINGSVIKYGRRGGGDTSVNFDGSINLDWDDVTYSAKTNRGVKGKELITHELGHLEDNKNYDGIPRKRAQRDREMRADLNVIKKFGYGSKEYRRMVKGARDDTYRRLSNWEPYKNSSSEEQREMRQKYLRDEYHSIGRNRLLKYWKKYRRLGLKENTDMSYAGYIRSMYEELHSGVSHDDDRDVQHHYRHLVKHNQSKANPVKKALKRHLIGSKLSNAETRTSVWNKLAYGGDKA